MFRILNAEPEGYSPEATAILTEVADLRLEAVDRGKLLVEIGGYDALIVRLAHRIDCEVLAAASRLRFIASATTGLDHINVEEAARRGIDVISLKGEAQFLRSIPATAELTWGLILALTRRIPAAAEGVRNNGLWDRGSHIGEDLAGRRLGLVGCGRIGERVARYAFAFDMRVAAFDPLREVLPRGVERFASLAALAAASDIVSVHVPLATSTANLIDRRTLSVMRPGGYFVNTSRGGVVDEAALMDVLDSGILAGAALDVLTSEDRLLAGEHHPVIQAARTRHNLIVTPHIGGASRDSMLATEIFIAKKLRDAIAELASGTA